MNQLTELSKRFLGLGILFICFLGLSAQDRPNFNQLEKGVVTVLTYNSSGTFIGHGSGFFVDNYGTVVTNYHVVEDVYKIIIKTSNGKRYIVNRIVSGDKSIDLVKLSISTTKNDFYFLKYSFSSVGKGVKCWTIGTPRDTTYSGTITNGIISNIHENQIPVMLQTNAQYTHGSSGGPMVNSGGYVIGVISGGDGSTDGARANINFAISIKEINNLRTINKIRMINPYKVPANVSFKIDKLKYKEDVSLSVDGIFIGYFEYYFNTSNIPSCGDSRYLNVSLLPGTHSIRAYEKSTGGLWSFNISISPGEKCKIQGLINKDNTKKTVNPTSNSRSSSTTGTNTTSSKYFITPLGKRKFVHQGGKYNAFAVGYYNSGINSKYLGASFGFYKYERFSKTRPNSFYVTLDWSTYRNSYNEDRSPLINDKFIYGGTDFEPIGAFGFGLKRYLKPTFYIAYQYDIAGWDEKGGSDVTSHHHSIIVGKELGIKRRFVAQTGGTINSFNLNGARSIYPSLKFGLNYRLRF